jgi:signal transduction histidine kinase/ligand-binding sensor domain-containing protein
MKFVLPVLTLTALLMQAAAQTPFPHQYSMNDGLPSERIFCAAQDKRGFLWLGTDAGLCFFNGRKFFNYTMNDGLADNHVTGVYADRKNRLWIFHPSGRLSLIENNVISNSDSKKLLSGIENQKQPQSIAEDLYGNVWFGYAGGSLSKLSPAGALVHYASPLPGEFDYAPEFYLTSDNELWVIYSSRFYNYNYDTDEFEPLLGPVIQTQSKLVFHFISPSNALFMTPKGVERIINKNYGVVLSLKRITLPDKIELIHYDHNNNIWLSSCTQKTYFYFYDKGAYRDGIEIFSGVQVTGFFTDSENNLWVCTDGSGLYRFSAVMLTGNYLTSRDGLTTDRLIRILPFSKDQWVAVGSDGSSSLIADKKIFPLTDAFENYSFKPVVADADSSTNTLMIGCGNQLQIYRNRNARILSVNDLTGDKTKSNKQKIGDVIFDGKQWLLAIDSAVYSISFYGPSVKLKKEFSSSFIITRLKAAPDNRLFAVMNKKVFEISANPPEVLTPGHQSVINDIHLTSDSILLVATSNEGLYGYQSGKLVFQFKEFNGEPTGSINRITLSSEGIIWLASQTGIYRLLINNRQIETSEQFNFHDGLLSNSVTDIAIRNNLLTVGYKGLNIFPANLIKYIAEPPAVYLSLFNYDFKNHSITDGMKLKYRKGPLHIEFESPVYQSPDEVKYQYKLNGYNEEWTETRNNFAEYSSLEPGTYIFQVQAKKANSGWSKPVFVKFEITAPFYGTLLFRLIVANTLVLILYLVLRNMVSAKFRKRLAVYERERALEMERNRISRDMHDDLGADLTNIVIISKIARQILKLKPEERDVIDRIEAAANDVINKMNEIIWALNPSNDTLSNLVAYLHRYLKENLETAQIDFEVIIPQHIPNVHLKAGYRRNIFLVVKESVHNAVKHSSASMIKVEILLLNSAKNLKIIITDNGKGFNIDERTGSGNGLLNMKKRMNEINGLYTISSSIGKGTTITLEVPLPS